MLPPRLEVGARIFTAAPCVLRSLSEYGGEWGRKNQVEDPHLWEPDDLLEAVSLWSLPYSRIEVCFVYLTINGLLFSLN